METPVRKVTFDSPYGGDGDIPFDEEGYHNTVMNLNMYVEGGPRTASNNREIIFNWFNSGKYMDFIPYFDPDKVYKVMTTTPPKFTSVYYGRGTDRRGWSDCKAIQVFPRLVPDCSDRSVVHI